MTQELKPCPFCGGEHIKLVDLSGWEAWCEDCGACAGCTTNGDANTREQMIAAWNRRALESASQPGSGEVGMMMVPKEPTEQWCARLARKSYGAGFTAEKTTLKFCATLIRDVLSTAPKRAAPSAGNGGAKGGRGA